MHEVRFTSAHILNVLCTPRHQVINLAALAVGIADLLQSLCWDLNQVNMTIAMQLGLVCKAIPRHFVHMVRGNPQATSVSRPEPDLIKRDAHKAWLAVLLRPVACVLELKLALHVH